MHYFCSTCTNRVEGKLEIEVVIMCKTCGRYYTLAELILYNTTVELRSAFRPLTKDKKYGIIYKTEGLVSGIPLFL